MPLISESKPQFQKAIDHLSQGLNSIRTGQANPALVENIQVNAYGAMQPIKALASISVPDPKTLQIEAWDMGVIKSIESAIASSDIGINPNVDGKTIRLNMPQMTDEMRQKMVKIVKEKMEEARIAVRQIREDVKKKIGKLEGIGDDEKRSMQDELEETVKEFNATIDEMGKKKEEEVTSI